MYRERESVCVCVCVCICVFVCMCVYAYIHTYMYVYVCVCVWRKAGRISTCESVKGAGNADESRCIKSRIYDVIWIVELCISL